MKTIKITKLKKTKISDLYIVAFLLFLLIMPLFIFDKSGKNITIIISFLVNGVIFCMGIFYAQRKYSVSMELIYWMFMLIFMYIAPMVQYFTLSYPWHGQLSESIIFQENMLILVFCAFFAIGKLIASKVKIKSKKNDSYLLDLLCTNFEFSKYTKIVVTLVVMCLAGYSLSQTGLIGIVVSRVQATQVFYSGSSSAIELIVESIVPAFIAYVVAEAAQGLVDKKGNSIRFLILIICLLVCFFPTTIPRYKMATIYGAIFLVLFPKIKKNSRFFWLFSIAIFIVFPLLSSVRNIISIDNFQNVFENGILSVYLKGDYDAYRMLASAIQYVSENGHVFGAQLLGVLLFFIPSSIWTTKPVGSGAFLIKNELGSNAFSNVSCPYIAEGYINFGVLGVIGFAIILGIVIYKLDSTYWKSNGDKSHIVFAPYLFIVFMLFFVLRGDLLSGFAYLCGFIITGILLRLLTKKTNKTIIIKWRNK